MAGFRKHRSTGIVLETGQTLRADVQLEIGSVTDSVHVTAEVAALNTENGAIKGDVIVQQEINDLPLDGRDFTDLAFLVPGVMPDAQGGPGSFASINGARAGLHELLRGRLQRPQCRAAPQPRCGRISTPCRSSRWKSPATPPSIGRMAGGVLNMVMRSGTNQLHGDVFEYIRNDVIDARGFFDADKNPLHRNQFGAMSADRSCIPKLYNGHDRTFFMFSWESYRQHRGRPHHPRAVAAGTAGRSSRNRSALTSKAVP